MKKCVRVISMSSAASGTMWSCTIRNWKREQENAVITSGLTAGIDFAYPDLTPCKSFTHNAYMLERFIRVFVINQNKRASY